MRGVEIKPTHSFIPLLSFPSSSLVAQLKEPLLVPRRSNSTGSYFDVKRRRTSNEQKEGSELKAILGGETGDEFMPNFISEVVHVKSAKEGVEGQEAQKKVDKHITSLLQYRLATHLASERLYLVWQRCR